MESNSGFKLWLPTLIAILSSVAITVVAWVAVLCWWPSLNVERLSDAGGAISPVVGIVSLTAVFAALRSVRIQNDALLVQRTALEEQRVSLKEAMDLQREAVRIQAATLEQERVSVREDLDIQRRANALQAEALAEQRRSLEHELTLRKHAALGSAYALLFGALDVYERDVSQYVEWLSKNNGDRLVRADRQRPIYDKAEDVRRSHWQVLFIDGDTDRIQLADSLASPLRLEPEGADTSTTQRAHASRCREQLDKRATVRKELRERLIRELRLDAAER